MYMSDADVVVMATEGGKDVKDEGGARSESGIGVGVIVQHTPRCTPTPSPPLLISNRPVYVHTVTHCK